MADIGAVPFHEALSGIAGSISLVAWIFLLVPQVVENYVNGSADGVSLGFILVWLLGDVCNFFGSFWAQLLPTVIALGAYFLIADVVLLSQMLYYRRLSSLRRARRRSSTRSRDHERAPLLTEAHTPKPAHPHEDAASEERTWFFLFLNAQTTAAAIPRNVLALLGVCAFGTLGWVIAWKTGTWTVPGQSQDAKAPLGAEVLGYASAALYLGARLPQIAQNFRRKSCDGLSLLFFLLSLTGNVTYGAGILLHSTERSYVLMNLPWLLGSLGTIVEDGLIFMQFHWYKDHLEERESDDDDDEEEDVVVS